MATYLLLDGHSLAFRAWFALQEAGMKTASGQQTEAVYGFVSMTTKLLSDFRPDGLAVAFDRSGPTFRDAIADDYKAGRAETPDPLVSQIELIRQFVLALGIPALDAEGYEADDVLATLATRLEREEEDVIVVTGDRDAFQLVSDPHVKVLYNRRGVSDYVLYDETGIRERTGVSPADYPLLSALRGDPSDNLAGVPGVGEKTAAKLVGSYHDIDGIYENLESCTPKLRASLALHEQQVRRNLLLTPAVRDVPLSVEKSDLSLASVDRDALNRLFAFLEMRTPRDRLFAALDETTEEASAQASDSSFEPRPVRLVETVADATDYLSELVVETGGEETLALEPLWKGLPGRSELSGLAFVVEGAEETVYLAGHLLDDPQVCRTLQSVMKERDGSRPVVAHRARELMRALLPLGIDFTRLYLDTAVAAYLIDPASGQASLEDLATARGFSGHGAVALESGQLGFSLDGGAAEVSEAEQTAARAELVALVARELRSELDAVSELELFEEVERPLIRVLAKMEVAGIAIEPDRLSGILKELTDEANRLEAEIVGLAGEPFNVNSTTQLRTVLYEKLGLKPLKKTKTGYSTDAQTLERLRDEHPIVEALLRYREVEKLRSTYGEGLLGEIAPDGRIHASFNQTVARTGRLSSDQPNLHNIPVRTEEGRRFREVFVPVPGFELAVADYNQIELRVIAHLSGDPGLTEAFDEQRDIHATTAARIFSVELDEVTPQMRAKAKMVSYGLAYGMEAYGLAQRLGIGADEAGQILESYFVAFPAVRSYMDKTVADARLRGYTETERGRRRYLPELGSSNFRVRQAAERQAMNAGIQGLAADIFKIALVRLDAALEKAQLSARIVLQVHDEILVESPLEEHDEVERLLGEAMRNAYPLTVPLEVHLAWGASWADAK